MLSLEATGSASRVRRRRRLGASPSADSLAPFSSEPPSLEPSAAASGWRPASPAGASSFLARVRRFLGGSGAASAVGSGLVEAPPPVRSMTWARDRRFLGAASWAGAVSALGSALAFLVDVRLAGAFFFAGAFVGSSAVSSDALVFFAMSGWGAVQGAGARGRGGRGRTGPGRRPVAGGGPCGWRRVLGVGGDVRRGRAVRGPLGTGPGREKTGAGGPAVGSRSAATAGTWPFGAPAASVGFAGGTVLRRGKIARFPARFHPAAAGRLKWPRAVLGWGDA